MTRALAPYHFSDDGDDDESDDEVRLEPGDGIRVDLVNANDGRVCGALRDAAAAIRVATNSPQTAQRVCGHTIARQKTSRRQREPTLRRRRRSSSTSPSEGASTSRSRRSARRAGATRAATRWSRAILGSCGRASSPSETRAAATILDPSAGRRRTGPRARPRPRGRTSRSSTTCSGAATTRGGRAGPVGAAACPRGRIRGVVKTRSPNICVVVAAPPRPIAADDPRRRGGGAKPANIRVVAAAPPSPSG